MDERQSKLDPKLIDAYKSTLFQIFLDDTIVTLKIGEKCEPLRNLFQQHSVNSACYITAHNPFGRLLSEKENETRNAELTSELAEQYQIYEGVGIDPAEEWEGERSILALGVSFSKATDLAKRYEQNAVVFVDEALLASLIFIR